MSYLSLILIFMMPAVAFGRIGETKEQCDKRYGLGKPLNHKGMEALVYHKEGFVIFVRMFDNTCQAITYGKPDRSKLKAREIRAFLDINGDNWIEKDLGKYLRWKSKDLTAFVKADDYDSLVIQTNAYFELEQKMEAQKAREKLEGF